MTRRGAFKWVGIAALGAAFSAGFVLPLLSARINTRRDQALCQLKVFATAVAMYESDMGASPADGLADCRDPAIFSSTVLARLCPLVAVVRTPAAPGRKRYLDIPPERLCTLAMLDPWGRPYRMALRQPRPQSSTPGQPAALVIWSLGRNGRDEGGGGDDVVDPSLWHGPVMSR